MTLEIPKGMWEELEKLDERIQENVWISRAPGRVEVLGNHTDYNGGIVLASTVDRFVWVLGKSSDDVKLHSMNFDEGASFDPKTISITEGNEWQDYARGIFWALNRRNHNVKGITASVYGDLAMGRSLGSSAAFEIALLNLVMKTSNLTLQPKVSAMLGFEAERLFCSVACGVTDQFASQMGKKSSLLAVNCTSMMTQDIPISTELRLITIDSMEPSEAGDTLNERRVECQRALATLIEAEWDIRNLSDIAPEYLAKTEDVLDEKLYRRVRHIVEENARVRKGIELLSKNDVVGFGKLMGESHNSSRNLYEVSNPNLDLLVEIAMRQNGVFGSKMTGAGRGALVLAIVKQSNVEEFVKAISSQYEKESGKYPTVTVFDIPGGVITEQTNQR
ncbi:MAG: galactokinase [Candidatus Thorarchaeota archaeon]